MIRKTLKATQLATFSIDLPHADLMGMPSPTGTGFFVSADGWFVTAAHVVAKKDAAGNYETRPDIDQGLLVKELRPDAWEESGAMCQKIKCDYLDPVTDFALLKVDFAYNRDKAWLKGRSEFPFIQVSTRELEEGEPVYSFGYPLSASELLDFPHNPGLKAGHTEHSPRVTSAIVASTMESTKMVWSTGDTRVYVLDKALNYGNSGGPIVSADTGKVHAFCSRFSRWKFLKIILRISRVICCG